jgi:hypothetical protein
LKCGLTLNFFNIEIEIPFVFVFPTTHSFRLGYSVLFYIIFLNFFEIGREIQKLAVKNWAGNSKTSRW